ncbi:MAG: PEP-CTERM sorting domain-containing protein [Phycisphaerales bacterium]|nr:PEP-CTERM sorting domain-containing protein [Phycisphaerales bacterium]
MKNSLSALVVVVGAAAFAAPALAGFGGQTILGPLGPESIVSGDTTGASNDNDGWYSGDHIFDLWDGGDDVWQLDWPGGNIVLDMFYDNFVADPDLFLYTPSNLDESALDSYINTGHDHIEMANAPAGTYYVLVDCSAGAEGEYRLTVGPVPAPGTLGLVLAGLVGIGRRSRGR